MTDEENQFSSTSVHKHPDRIIFHNFFIILNFCCESNNKNLKACEVGGEWVTSMINKAKRLEMISKMSNPIKPMIVSNIRTKIFGA